MERAEPLTADVVVLGTGPGGMAAVAAAVEAGAEVVAVESREHIGGNAVWSTGYLTFVDSDMQHDQGLHDSVETFLADCERVVVAAADRYGVIWDRDLTRLFAEHSAETYRILSRRGVRFSRFIPRPLQHSVDRMAAVEDTWMLHRAFQPDFDGPAVRTLYRTTADRLLTDNGRVVGVRVRPHRTGPDDGPDDAGGPVRDVHARRGVVLATGGYQANPSLRRRYQPGHLATAPYLGVDTCRGDGHLMGQAVGGDLVNMTYVPPLVIVSSSLVEDAIAVNRDGRRFHDEAGPYDDRVAALLDQPDRLGYYLFDAAVARAKAALVGQMPEPPVTAGTLAELAALIGCPADHLAATVQEWNAFLAGDGQRDPAFGRVVLPAGRRGLTEPPYHAARMVVGVNFVSGGFTVTPAMQVVDVFGRAIPGLFAAGDCVGGLNPTADLGGIHISGGLTLGRLAGDAAARGESSVRTWPSPQGDHLPSMLDTRMPIVPLSGASE